MLTSWAMTYLHALRERQNVPPANGWEAGGSRLLRLKRRHLTGLWQYPSRSRNMFTIRETYQGIATCETGLGDSGIYVIATTSRRVGSDGSGHRRAALFTSSNAAADEEGSVGVYCFRLHVFLCCGPFNVLAHERSEVL